MPEGMRFRHPAARAAAALLAAAGAAQVDIVGHSLGTTLAREWLRQDAAYDRVRRLVGVDGPNHGILNCSPNPRNYWQQPALGGFDPTARSASSTGQGTRPSSSNSTVSPRHHRPSTS